MLIDLDLIMREIVTKCVHGHEAENLTTSSLRKCQQGSRGCWKIPPDLPCDLCDIRLPLYSSLVSKNT